ncbi:MAG: TlyA family RNA methyltransferase, partial [Allobaculum sp.]|nr:TlyA family RNA methyltransferase [Allobaculum sp.]
MRLDQYLSDSLGSRTRAADAIKARRVQVNGKVVTKPAFEVEEQDDIQVAPI